MMTIDDRYDAMISMVIDLESAADAARRLGLAGMTDALEAMAETMAESGAALEAQLDARDRVEALRMNFEYERGIIG